jgi:purine-cytosine permease-like protein
MEGFMDISSGQEFSRMAGQDNLFIFFRLLKYLPYVAVGLLIISIAIWVIFGIKKFRWAKIIAIILTILVFITGLLSLGNLFVGGFRRGMPENMPRNSQEFREYEDNTGTGNKSP